MQIFEGISNRTWDTIIEHAKACEIDDHKFYAYHRTEQDVSLLFNSIYKVVGAMVNGQYCSLDELTPLQTVCIHILELLLFFNISHLFLICCHLLVAMTSCLTFLYHIIPLLLSVSLVF